MLLLEDLHWSDKPTLQLKWATQAQFAGSDPISDAIAAEALGDAA